MFPDDDKTTPRPELTMSVLVVDVERFSGRDDEVQSDLQVFIVDVLHRAFERAKLGRLWADAFYKDGTGDGYIVCFGESGLWFAVQELFDALQEELQRSAMNGDAELRMRAALNVGPVPSQLDVRLDSPVGKTMIDTCRMVDSDQLRVLLKRSDPQVTRLAVAATDAVLNWTLWRKRRGWHRASEYVAHELTVKGKAFDGVGHLHVPAPSGDLLVDGLAGVQRPDAETETETVEPETAAVAGTAVTVDGDRDKTYTDVTGDVRDESVSVGDISGDVGVLGRFANNGDVAGRDVVRDGTVYNAGRDVNRPMGDVNNGTDSGRRIRPDGTGTGSAA